MSIGQVQSVLRGNVLVAEDNPSNQVLIELILKRFNLVSVLAEDGLKALEKFKAEKFDIILMDIMMPNMNGYEATAAIREIDKDIPIVAVTANAMKGDREKCLAAGCTDYISKPVTRDKLQEVLSKYLITEESEDILQGECVVSTQAEQGPIVSELADDPDLYVVADMFVERLCEVLDKLQFAIDSNDLQAMRELLHELKGSGGSAGYPIITEKSRFVESLILEDKIEELADAIPNFINLCKRVEPPSKMAEKN